MLIFQAIKCCFEISVLGSYAQDLRDKTDDEMHQYASPYRLGILVKISGYRTKNCSAKHHRKIVSHVKHEEEQSRDPYREMLVIFLAGSSDIILNDSLYEELLQNRADRIEPSHVGRKIKSEPRSLSDLGEKLVLYKTDDHKDDNESCAHDSADDKVFLILSLPGLKHSKWILNLVKIAKRTERTIRYPSITLVSIYALDSIRGFPVTAGNILITTTWHAIAVRRNNIVARAGVNRFLIVMYSPK